MLGVGILIFSFQSSKTLPPKSQRIQLSQLSGFQTQSISEQGSRNILDGLTLEQKVGQMFIIGFEGKEINQELETLIKHLHPGGVLLLERNIENPGQLRKLTAALQKISREDTGLPLFVAVDQEGGKVCRVNFLDCQPPFAIRDEREAFSVGLKRGEALKELGVNLNLAPVLDQASPGDFIFERTFQRDLQEAGFLAEAFILGQKKAGILTAIKHFPGYGGIAFNPETEKLLVFSQLPAISQFQKAAEAGVEMVMPANAIYSQISLNLPFSLSLKGINFLKEKLHGCDPCKLCKDILIISDDLSSPVLKNAFSLPQTIILAKKAGVDLLLVSGFWDSQDPEKAYKALLEAVKEGKISEKEIEKTVLKIIQLKEKFEL